MKSGNISKNKKEKEIKSKFDLKNKLKTGYFLERIFSYISRKKALKIMKISKYVQKFSNISINDYKEYSQLHSSIEIELIPEKNKSGEFIRIPDKDYKYYHIYFNDSKIERKGKQKGAFKESDNVKKIRILIDYEVTSFKNLFSCYDDCISSISFKTFYRNNITEMDGMFYRCYSLKELDLSNFNTDNVTTMQWMFRECPLLKKLNLSKFNTNNVTNMESMFYQCSSLKELNLSTFNTNNVTNMDSMFFKCSSLISLNLSNFNNVIKI